MADTPRYEKLAKKARELETALRKCTGSEGAQAEAEKRFRLLAELAPVGIVISDRKEKTLYVSPKFVEMFGYDANDMPSVEAWWPLAYPDPELRENVRQEWKVALARAKESGEEVPPMEFPVTCKDGNVRHVEFRFTTTKELNFVVFTDITDRKQAEETLRESENKLKAAFEGSHDAITITSEDGEVIDCNISALRLFGLDRKEEFASKRPADFSPPTQADGSDSKEMSRRYIEAVFTSGEPKRFEWLHQRTTGEIIPTEVILTAYTLKNKKVLHASIRDITERKNAEAEQENLRNQLLQAQKMESVGRLAGGVAHDFNNMLGVILGRTEMMLMDLPPEDPHYAELEEIQKVALRSAELTRQLLAFARKQTITPKVLNLNDTVEGMLKMLRRLIGEDINLVWHPDAHLWPVKMDPAQVDQILANLSANARGAIAGVGKVTIETENAVLDEDDCVNRADFTPGAYVLLTVTDDGCGMDAATRAQIFEPFFTTRGVGEGTGLGLATVYGIVKQNSGFIDVYSEVGKGTTFKIYIPRHEGSVVGEIKSGSGAVPMGRGETVLLVEDDPSILNMGKMMLEKLGYTVLHTGDPNQALDLAEKHAGPIHLLMTDVVMPQMSGKDLARKMKTRIPGIKVLFMSGYTANVIAHRGILDAEVHFIQKPFSVKDLAVKVREALSA